MRVLLHRLRTASAPRHRFGANTGAPSQDAPTQTAYTGQTRILLKHEYFAKKTINIEQNFCFCQ